MKANWKKELKRVNLYSPEQKVRDYVRDEAFRWVKEEILPLLTVNVEAIILWQLHEKHNKGKKWLLNFLNDTTPLINGILDRYDYETDNDAIWVCKHKLKTEVGIDLDALEAPFNATLKLTDGGTEK
jgi:hypothetical protein